MFLGMLLFIGEPGWHLELSRFAHGVCMLQGQMPCPVGIPFVAKWIEPLPVKQRLNWLGDILPICAPIRWVPTPSFFSYIAPLARIASRGARRDTGWARTREDGGGLIGLGARFIGGCCRILIPKGILCIIQAADATGVLTQVEQNTPLDRI